MPKINTDWNLNRFQTIYEPGVGYVVNRILYKADHSEPLVSCVDRIACFVYELEAEVFCKFRNEMLIKYDSDGPEMIEFPIINSGVKHEY